MKKNNSPIVWITGASKGIGAAIADGFAFIGATVVLSGRNIALLKKQTTKIQKSGGSAFFVPCDITSEKSIRTAHQKIITKIGNVDILVNNAGVTTFTPFIKTSTKQFDEIFATNVRGMFLCTQMVLPSMLKKKSGHIFNILSVAANTVFLNSSIYSASKSAALTMSRCLRAEVRKKSVRVIDVLPGAVETDMWSRSDRKILKEKMMQPSDIADVIVSLYCQPQRLTTDEIILRPVEGDL